MPAYFRLFAVSAVVLPFLLTTNVSATPSATSAVPFNPAGILPLPVPFVENILKGADLPSVPETNAQRMKRGLGPKKPNFNYPKRALHPRQSNTPCTNPAGYIRVSYVNGDGVEVDGYLGAAPNDFGEYPFIGGQDGALRVQLNNCNANGGPFDISTLNGITSQPYLGLIDGFSNQSPVLGPDSYNYVYIGGTSQTPPGSPPLVQSNSFTDATDLPEAVESAVWGLGPDGTLTAAWVNPDNSIPPEVLLYIPSAGTFTVTADLDDFRNTFGPAFPATFTFIAA